MVAHNQASRRRCRARELGICQASLRRMLRSAMTSCALRYPMAGVTGDHQKAGGQAARGSSSSCRSGYHRWNTAIEFLIERFHPRLQQQMRPALGPLPLLLLAEAPADHLVDRRLDKARADALARAIVLAVVGDEGAIPLDIGMELLSTAFSSFRAAASPVVATATSRSIARAAILWNAL